MFSLVSLWIRWPLNCKVERATVTGYDQEFIQLADSLESLLQNLKKKEGEKGAKESSSRPGAFDLPFLYKPLSIIPYTRNDSFSLRTLGRLYFTSEHIAELCIPGIGSCAPMPMWPSLAGLRGASGLWQ